MNICTKGQSLFNDDTACFIWLGGSPFLWALSEGANNWFYQVLLLIRSNESSNQLKASEIN